MIGAPAMQMPFVALPGASEPLCRAPQTVELTTLIHARPNRARELATLLESMPMSVCNPPCHSGRSNVAGPLRAGRTAAIILLMREMHVM